MKHCPNCGTMIGKNLSGVCSHCAQDLTKYHEEPSKNADILIDHSNSPYAPTNQTFNETNTNNIAENIGTKIAGSIIHIINQYYTSPEFFQELKKYLNDLNQSVSLIAQQLEKSGSKNQQINDSLNNQFTQILTFISKEIELRSNPKIITDQIKETLITEIKKEMADYMESRLKEKEDKIRYDQETVDAANRAYNRNKRKKEHEK